MDHVQAFVLGKFDELLILEPNLSHEGLRRSQREVLARASDPTFWQGLYNHARSRRRRTLRGIYQRRTPTGLVPTLRVLIATKLKELGEKQ